jgi:hypothetical protein
LKESPRPVSRAERRVIPPRPTLFRAIRVAAVDLYYNLIRLVAANVLWGAAILLIAFLASAGLLGFILLILLVPLTAGLMGMATELVRTRSLVLSDFVAAIRKRFWTHLGIGVAQLVITLVAVTNLIVGSQTAGILGPILVVSAFYTLVALWILAVSTWPLLLDPVRAEDPVRRTVRVGATLILAHPVAMSALAAFLAAFFAISAVFAAAIVTVSGAFGLLVAAHFVLPAADRLEQRATLELPED